MRLAILDSCFRSLRIPRREPLVACRGFFDRRKGAARLVGMGAQPRQQYECAGEVVVIGGWFSGGETP